MDFQINNISLPSQSLNQRSQKIVYLNNSDYITATCCPVCGSKDTRTLSLIQTKTQKGLQTDFCTNCDHIFFSRYPTQDWYSEYYNTRQDSSHNKQLCLTTRLKRFIRTKPIIYNFWLKKLRARHTKGAAIEAILREAITKANLLYLTRPKINKVLDIGCGYGGNLQFFQSIGLSPIGIDASPARVASCTANGLRAIQVPLSDISAVRSEGPFDLITSSHVLEHIVD